MYRQERMSDELLKYHMNDGTFPFDFVVHHFTGIDKEAPHDHPFNFRSMVVKGWYIEKVYRKDGSSYLQQRNEGDVFEVDAEHIHQIVALPEGECWTIIFPGPKVRDWGFWDLDEKGKMVFRPKQEYEPEFK